MSYMKCLVFSMLFLLIFSTGCINPEHTQKIEDLEKQLQETEAELAAVRTQVETCSPPRIPYPTTAPSTPGANETDPTAPANATNGTGALLWYERLSTYEINTNAKRISYDDLVRKNEQYGSTIVLFTGQVSKIWGNYDSPYGVTVLTKTNSAGTYNDEPIYLPDYGLDPRLIKGDIINFWGVPDGFLMDAGSPTTTPQLIPLQAIVE